MSAPLVVTLLLGEEAQGRFDRLRAAHFPSARNHLAAHVTLFHALPGEHLADVTRELAEVADRAPFDVAVTGVRGPSLLAALGGDQQAGADR